MTFEGSCAKKEILSKARREVEITTYPILPPKLSVSKARLN